MLNFSKRILLLILFLSSNSTFSAVYINEYDVDKIANDIAKDSSANTKEAATIKEEKKDVPEQEKKQ